MKGPQGTLDQTHESCNGHNDSCQMRAGMKGINHSVSPPPTVYYNQMVCALSLHKLANKYGENGRNMRELD